MTDEEIDAFLDAQGPSDEELDAFLDAEEPAGPDVSMAESAYRGAVQGGSFRLGDEIAAGIGAGLYGVARGVRAFLPGGVPEDAPGVVDVYRAIRDQEQAQNLAAQQANPGTYLAGEVAGGLAVTGTNPVSAVRSVGGAVLGGGRALLSGTPGAARSLLSLESAAGAAAGVKAAATGAGYAGLAAAGGSEADLTRGEFGEFASDVVEGAKPGAVVGFLARGLLSARSASVAQRAVSAADDAATAARVAEFDERSAMLPAQQAAVKAGNAEVVAAAKAQNIEAREAAAAQNLANAERYGAESAAAKAEAKAATQAKQAEAQAAAEAKALENPLKRTRLEGKQKALGGGPRAKVKAQALLNEPDPVNPQKKLFESAEKLSVDEQVDLAERLRRSAGRELGKIRDEFAKSGATIPAAEARVRMVKAFEDLSTDIRQTAVDRVDAMISAASTEGTIPAAALRTMIRDVEQFARTRTPKLEADFGAARGKVFTAAGDVLKGLEAEVLAAKRPDLVPAYTEWLRKYGVYSDFETSARVAFDRFYKGQPVVRLPKAGKVEPVAPRAVQKPAPAEPEMVQPVLLPEPQPPQFQGGDEALAKGRQLLAPSRTARTVGFGLRIAAAEGGARAGALLPVPGSIGFGANRGAVAGQAIEDIWLRWMTPTPAKLSARVQKLERLRPMMEEALEKGPAEVARVHALFMQRSPDYRKAIESEE